MLFSKTSINIYNFQWREAYKIIVFKHNNFSLFHWLRNCSFYYSETEEVNMTHIWAFIKTMNIAVCYLMEFDSGSRKILRVLNPSFSFFFIFQAKFHYLSPFIQLFKNVIAYSTSSSKIISSFYKYFLSSKIEAFSMIKNM